MKSNHVSKDCHFASCKKCDNRHYPLLRYEIFPWKSPLKVQSLDENMVYSNLGGSSEDVSHTSWILLPHNVLIYTVIAAEVINNGKSQNVRVLLKFASQSIFLTEEVFKKLGLLKKNI